MADKTYGLYPFPWHPPGTRQVMSGGVLIDVTIPGYHSAPNGAGCLFDWRPIGEQAKQGPSDGYGFFAWTGQPPQDLIVLGVGDCRTIVATSTMRSELRLKLGLSRDPAGATLIDLCHDVMGPLASPDGSTGVRPLMPTREEEIEMHLAGHSRVKVVKFTPAQLLAANPTGHANRIRDVIRAGIDTADAVGGVELAGKVLGSWLLTCGISREEIKLGAPGKKSQWERLLSAKIKAKHGAAMKPKEPKTSFSETWPNDCADIEATAQDQTWDVVPALFSAVVVKVASGTARASGAFAFASAVCNSTVSSTDHYCQSDVTVGPPGNASNASVIARAAAYINEGEFVSTIDGYRATADVAIGAFADELLKTWKYVSGVATLIGVNADLPSASGTLKIRANGSSITRYYTGAANDTVTDSAITGPLKGAVILWYGTAEADAQSESWLIDDEVAAAPVNPGVSARMLLDGSL